MELRGSHVILTKAGLEEASALLAAYNGDEQFNVWSGFAPKITLSEVQADMQETLHLPEGTIWRITDTTHTLVGAAATALVPPPSTAWIALLLIMRSFQGRGYGSEAAAQLENHLFSSPHITQVGLAVLVQNGPALAFWEKRGYVRGERSRDTQNHDVYKLHLPRPSVLARP